MAMLRTSFERRTSAQDVEPLGKSAEIKQLAVKDQIAAAHLQKKGQPALSIGRMKAAVLAWRRADRKFAAATRNT